MKNPLAEIFHYIRSYYVSGFRLFYFLIILLMLSGLIWFNYFHLPVKNLAGESWVSHFTVSYFLYLLPFATAFALQYFFYPHTAFLKNRSLLALILVSPAIFAFRVNFDFHHSIIEKYFSGDAAKFWLRCTDWVVRASFILAVLYTISFFYKRTYSYAPAGFNKLKPYFLMICIMAPVIAVAAFQPSFLQMYPRAQVVTGMQLPNKLLHYFIFEISYAFDFISIESFFRGFLIFTFMRICGTNCIVPAACFYCCIHLGKPMGEAISSFWGGMLLGIVSYHTKNIWGGIVIHIGIAALMEIAGFAAHQF